MEEQIVDTKFIWDQLNDFSDDIISWERLIVFVDVKIIFNGKSY